jgi:hypothetical protein
LFRIIEWKNSNLKKNLYDSLGMRSKEIGRKKTLVLVLITRLWLGQCMFCKKNLRE